MSAPDLLEGGAPPRRRPGRARVALAAVVVLATSGGLWRAARPDPTPPPAGPPVPSAAVEPVPGRPFLPSMAAFADATTGLVLGTACDAGGCRVLSRRTTDDGASWEPPVAVVGLDPALPRQGADRLLLAGRTALAWGPGLYRSTDAGREWARVAAPAEVVDVAVTGGRAWLLLADCGDQFGCRSRLATLDPGLSAVRDLPVQPLAQGRAQELVLLPDGRAGVLAGLLDRSAPAYLVVTGDGGGSWQRADLPCSGQSPRHLGGAVDAGFWLACDGLLHRSADGLSWRPVGPLPVGQATALTVASAAVGYLLDREAGLSATRDGGQSWTVVAPAQLARTPPAVLGDGFAVAAPVFGGGAVVTRGDPRAPGWVRDRSGFGP